MVKKAKLDILDIESEDESKSLPSKNVPQEKSADDEGHAEAKTGTFSPKIGIWIRKPLFWVVVAIMAFIVLSGAGLSVWFFYKQNEQVMVKQPEPTGIPTAVVKMGDIALFEGFVVDLKDEKGNTRIILCDVAIELCGLHDTAAIENRVDVRNAIYLFLKKRKPSELLHPDGRSRLKEDFKNELNRFLGEELVNRVYFARIETI